MCSDTFLLNRYFRQYKPLIYTDFYQFGIKVASTPPLISPFGNINNYKYIYTALIFCNSSVAGDKKTPYNSIFLAVNPFDKARYKFHRRGLFERQSATE